MNSSRMLSFVCAMAAASVLSILPATVAAQAVRTGDTAGEYAAVQQRLSRGWNTWDTNSMMTEVLLPEGLAVHAGMKNNTGEFGDRFLRDAFVGQYNKADARVTPGPHSWDGSYTSLDIEWSGHKWQIETAHAGGDEVILATPEKLAAENSGKAPALPPTIVFWVDFLWNRRGTTERAADSVETRGPAGAISIYCTCEAPGSAAGSIHDLPIGGPYFAASFTAPVGISSGPAPDNE